VWYTGRIDNMTTVDLKQVIGALMALPGFKGAMYDFIMDTPGEGLLEYCVDRCKAEVVLNHLCPDAIVEYACANCREELGDYMEANATVEVDSFTLSW
jgi:hypothetical protein